MLARAPKIAAVALAALLATPLLGGCSSSDAGDAGNADASTAADSSPDAGNSESSGGEAVELGADGATGNTADTSSFSYSDYLDENGHWKDVTALDYVELCDYRSIAVPQEEVAPTDEEIQAELDGLAEQFTTTEQVTDRAVEDGDQVNIDYVGTIDGVEFEGGNTNGNGTNVTIGVTQYIDDFLEQLIGHKPGETFNVEVTFPETYGVEELNGKDAVFEVTINHITEHIVPEINDDWVAANLQETYGWKTLAELKEDIATTLQARSVAEYVQDYVTENSEVSEVPAIVREAQEQMLIDQYQGYADSFGMELSDMLSMAAGVETTDQLIEQESEALDQLARNYLVFQAVAEDAGVDVTEADVLAYFQQNMNIDSLDELEAAYGMPYLKLCALTDKVAALLIGNAAVEE